jgi:hypothetical protein
MNPDPRAKADRGSYAARTAAYMLVANEGRRSASDGTKAGVPFPCAGASTRPPFAVPAPETGIAIRYADKQKAGVVFLPHFSLISRTAKMGTTPLRLSGLAGVVAPSRIPAFRPAESMVYR